MKLSPRSKRYLGLLLTIAVLGHLGLGHHGALAFVLCFEGDGHVAVERAVNGHCPRTARSLEEASTKKTSAYTLEAGESPCADVPIASGDHRTAKPTLESQERLPDFARIALAAPVIAVLPVNALVAEPVSFPDPHRRFQAFRPP